MAVGRRWPETTSSRFQQHRCLATITSYWSASRPLDSTHYFFCQEKPVPALSVSVVTRSIYLSRYILLPGNFSLAWKTGFIFPLLVHDTSSCRRVFFPLSRYMNEIIPSCVDLISTLSVFSCLSCLLASLCCTTAAALYFPPTHETAFHQRRDRMYATSSFFLAHNTQT